MPAKALYPLAKPLVILEPMFLSNQSAALPMELEALPLLKYWSATNRPKPAPAIAVPTRGLANRTFNPKVIMPIEGNCIV